MLSILSETKDVSLVQPHLKSVTKALIELFLETTTSSRLLYPARKKNALRDPVDPNGKGVEFWMCELEDMMKISVRESIKSCIADYLENLARSGYKLAWDVHH